MKFINYNIEKLEEAINNFYNATNVNINFLKSDFTPLDTSDAVPGEFCKAIQICPEANHRCNESDRELLSKCSETMSTCVHVCHAGLVDVAAPVVYDGEVLGYIILGQMKSTKCFDEVAKNVSNLGLDMDMLKEAYEKMPIYDEKKVHSVAGVATMLTKYIMLEAIRPPAGDLYLERAIEYIEQNLAESLTVDKVARGSGVSKTALYRHFHDKMGCTLNEYIKKRRIEKAMSLLETTDLSVETVSQEVGFASTSYFCRVFGAHTGMSPGAYRRK